MDNCCCVELKVTEDPIIALDIKEQFISGGEITPTGTKEISVTQNGTTTTDVTYYANAKVVANVPNTYAAADEGKVVQDGALEAQTTATFEANDVYDTTTIKQVTVDVPASAVDSGYVYINENDTVDVVGYAQAVVAVPASEVDTGTKSISVTANGTTTHDVVGYASASVTANVPNTYAAGDEGKVVDNGALVSQGSATYTINSTYDTTKIKSVTVNVSGGGTPTLQTKSVSYTPSESQQTAQVTADEGYDALQEVDVTVNAISSSYVGSGITRRDDTDLSASGATVSVPAGYYESSASKAVASGTAGTPTATKGTVSSHSVSVTPSVTNSAGYISGGTVTGTAVTVSASELVSGSETKTQNGTYNVTTLAELVVNVSGGGSSADPLDFSGGNILAIVGHGTEYIITDVNPSFVGIYGTKMSDNSVTNYEHYWSALGLSTQYLGLQRYSNSSNITVKGPMSTNIAYPGYSNGDVITPVFSTIGMAEATQHQKPLAFFKGYYNGNLESQVSAFTFYGLNIINSSMQYAYKFRPWLDNGVACIKDLVSGTIYSNSGTGAFDYIDLEGVLHNG